MDELKKLHSEEAERAALGCMFLDREAAALGKTLLVPDDFYTPLYGLIFQAMQKLEAVDVVTVSNELQRMGEWERVGLEWLAKISTSVSSSIYMRKYIEDLKRLSYLRRVVVAGNEMIQSAYKHERSGIENALEKIRLEGSVSSEIKTAAGGFTKRLEKLAKIRASGKKLMGITSGFIRLDEALGGLRDTDMIVLAARPSMGKSALAIDIGRNALKSFPDEKDCVGMISLEMSEEAVGQRIFTGEYMIDNDRLAVGGEDEKWAQTLDFAEEHADEFEKIFSRFRIEDDGYMTIEKIREKCYEWQRSGDNLRLIIVDYLQLLQGKGESRTREIGGISRGLKMLAKEFQCPVLALSQLSRKCEERADKRPMLSDLRESGDIEQDADVVLLLYREEYYFPDIDKKGIAELNIAKQREGPTGTIRLRWFNRSTTFRNLDEFVNTDEEPPEGWA